MSKNILKEPSFKLEPSFVALGFWLRKKNIQRIILNNEHIKKLQARIFSSTRRSLELMGKLDITEETEITEKL